MKYYWNTEPTGWVCPKCGKVYAPSVVECYNCNRGCTYSDGGTFIPETTTFTCVSCGRQVVEYGKMDDSGKCSSCLVKEMFP